MSQSVDWAKAYARQSDADFRAWERFEAHPQAVASPCHKLMMLQMACEKLCKARLALGGTPPESLQGSHAYIANPLPNIIRDQILFLGQRPDRLRELQARVRQLAGEIELLNPSVRRDGQRPDNCEYPWESGAGIISPLDWSFPTLQLLTVPAGRTFIKLLRGAIDRILVESGA